MHFLLRKPIPTIETRFLATGAGILTGRGLRAMAIVATARVHKRSNKTTQLSQILRLACTLLRKIFIQDHTQIQSMRLEAPEILFLIDLDIVRSHILIETVALATIFGVAWIPLRHALPKVSPKLFFLYAEQLLPTPHKRICITLRYTRRARNRMQSSWWQQRRITTTHHADLSILLTTINELGLLGRLLLILIFQNSLQRHRHAPASIHVMGLGNIIHDTTTQARIPTSNSNEVHVWIPALSHFHSPHATKWTIGSMWQNCWHNHTHVQLRSQSDDARRDVRTVTDKIITHLVQTSIHGCQSLTSSLRLRVHPMDVARCIIRTIQRRPNGYDTAKTHRILHDLIIAYILMHSIVANLACILRTNPRRSPRQMLHTNVKLLLALSPVHWRAANIATQRHELVHDRPHAFLATRCQHLPQFPARHITAADEASAHAPENISLHRDTLPASLLQQHRVNNGPQDSVTAQPVHKLAHMITQQMLTPLLRRYFSRS